MASLNHVAWLLEAEMFPDYRDALVAAICAQGRIVKLVPELEWGYRWDDVDSPYLKLFPAEACVVFHGSMELATRLKDHSAWIPTVYCDWTNYDCTNYYCHLSRFLLNADYVMLPFGELLRRKEFLFALYGKDETIFARPNSCRKSFTGQVAKYSTFAKDVEFMAFYDVPLETIVLISSPKTILREWRFVVVDKKVVTGSLYKSNGKLDKRPEMDRAALSLASEIAAQDFQPDRAWVLDICETDSGEFRLLEIGSFSFAEFYACDMAAVVRAVSKAAQEEWMNQHLTATPRSEWSN